MFTSRLPTSTSVRRPKSMADGTTSSIKRPSNIPVSVKKANLFTPQTAKRPFNFGNSTGGKSNFAAFGASTDRKSYTSRPTSKPMPDRDQQVKMLETLCEFLRRYGFPHPLPDAKKFFSSVSTTESARLFEFLIGLIIPDYKISRLEIDVPEALKQLNYPHIRGVTKSALVSVTTRQAVAGLLSIFHWIVLYYNQLNYDVEDQPVEESDEAMRLFENYLVISHIPHEQLENKHYELLQKYFPDSDTDQLEEELDAIKVETKQIESELVEIEGLLDIERVLREDIGKCQKYSDDMKQYVESKKVESEDVSAELQRELNVIEPLHLHVNTSCITEEEGVEIQDRYNSLITDTEEQNRKQQEELMRLNETYTAKLQETKHNYEHQIIESRAATDGKNQRLKEIRERYTKLMTRDDEKIKTRSLFLDRLRVDTVKAQSESVKQAESIKQNFINEGEIIMENLRKKGEYIEELDFKSRQKHQVLKDIHKRLKRLNITKFDK